MCPLSPLFPSYIPSFDAFFTSLALLFYPVVCVLVLLLVTFAFISSVIPSMPSAASFEASVPLVLSSSTVFLLLFSSLLFFSPCYCFFYCLSDCYLRLLTLLLIFFISALCLVHFFPSLSCSYSVHAENYLILDLKLVSMYMGLR